MRKRLNSFKFWVGLAVVYSLFKIVRLMAISKYRDVSEQEVIAEIILLLAIWTILTIIFVIKNIIRSVRKPSPPARLEKTTVKPQGLPVDTANHSAVRERHNQTIKLKSAAAVPCPSKLSIKIIMLMFGLLLVPLWTLTLVSFYHNEDIIAVGILVSILLIIGLILALLGNNDMPPPAAPNVPPSTPGAT